MVLVKLFLTAFMALILIGAPAYHAWPDQAKRATTKAGRQASSEKSDVAERGANQALQERSDKPADGEESPSQPEEKEVDEDKSDPSGESQKE